jgi:integrase
MQCVGDWKGNQAVSVYQTKDGRWRFRVMGHWNDGSSERVSGTAPKNDNNKNAAKQAEANQLAFMASHPNPNRSATEEEPPTSTPAPEGAASSEPAVSSEPARPIVTKDIPTLTAFAETFLAAAGINNKPSSIENKESVLRLHILPRIGHLRVCDVDFAVIQDLTLALQKAPNLLRKRKPRKTDPNPVNNVLHPNTVNKVLGCLKHVLRLAKRRHLIEEVPEITKLAAPEAKFDFLTFEEADRLVDAAVGEWRTMVLVALHTGLRRGELMALGKDAVDLQGRRVHVRRNYHRGRFGTPKSGLSREVPLSETATRALAAHKHARSDDLAFCDEKGRPFHPTRMRSELRRICKRAGLRRIGWHVLRHSFASHLVMRGVALAVVQKLMGHSSIVVTQRYAHLAPQVVRDAVLIFDRPTHVKPEPVQVAA